MEVKSTARESAAEIASAIRIMRNRKILLDEDLAVLYGVATKALLQAVKRNFGRFPLDFMFQLTPDEWIILRSQTVTSKSRRGGRRYPPYAFTEQGVAMLSSVLNGERAIAVNIQIMRAFVLMRGMLNSNELLARKLAELEANIEKRLADHDDAIAAILSSIRGLMSLPEPNRRGIGFTANLEEKSR
jgi:phage regulator Rha-like protein